MNRRHLTKPIHDYDLFFARMKEQLDKEQMRIVDATNHADDLFRRQAALEESANKMELYIKLIIQREEYRYGDEIRKILAGK